VTLRRVIGPNDARPTWENRLRTREAIGIWRMGVREMSTKNLRGKFFKGKLQLVTSHWKV
jgi:hypothetical protein